MGGWLTASGTTTTAGPTAPTNGTQPRFAETQTDDRARSPPARARARARAVPDGDGPDAAGRGGGGAALLAASCPPPRRGHPLLRRRRPRGERRDEVRRLHAILRFRLHRVTASAATAGALARGEADGRGQLGPSALRQFIHSKLTMCPDHRFAFASIGETVSRVSRRP